MTRLFGVIGHPVTHSFSPVLHTAAFRALRLDALYAPFDVPPRDLAPLLRGLLNAGVDGLNVTVPLKEAVLPLLDRVDATAQAMGAVNTIVLRHRRAVGYNTDGIGFMRALRELGWRPRPAHALILGSGGAARAVAWELSRWPGSRLTIANRHVERARRLVRWLAHRRRRARLEAVPLSRASTEGVELVVNATSLGMRPADGLPLAPSALRRGLVVYDLVYHRQTPLVRAAHQRGCLAAGGLSMLLYQGAESFRLWWRREPPIEAMRVALHNALRHRSGE